MSAATYKLISPSQKRLKRGIVTFVLFILGRSIQSASRFDKIIQQELHNWPETFTLVYEIFPTGPALILCKQNNTLIRCRNTENVPDMTIYIKNIEYAFLLMTSQKGAVQAFLEHGAFLKGDITIALSLIRILNRIQVYLYPRILAKRVVKRLPKISFYKRYIGRLRIILLGIPFGL